MKVILIILLIFQGFFQSGKQKTTIYMVGDSTMANKPIEDNPERGWGMMFQQFFDSSVVVENHAMNGRSTKTFISENRWQAVIDKLVPGDYVIIQFGHNDGSVDKKDRYTPPYEYKRNLIKFVEETRQKKANPILCTPIMRRRFDMNGVFYDSHGVYPDIVRNLADSLSVPLLDMHKKSEELIIADGDEESKKMFLFIDSLSYKSLPHGKQDNTHFSEYGATKMAELAVDCLKGLNIELAVKLLPKGLSKTTDELNLYENPVIHADYSDPDVINVNDTFYMVASSFNCVPGLPILESVDLVHWKIKTYALKKLLPEDVYSKPQHGCGVWAPAIRYYKGIFFIYYSDPDYGIFVTKSKNISGPWSEPVNVKAAKGWIDPCPFIDGDNNFYLVNAFAGSRAGIKSILVLNRMNIEGTSVTDNGILVFDGHSKHPTVEGPKMYKRNGYYYIFAPAGGVKPGWQLVLRSKNIYGPYEEKIILDQGNTSINGPHQGALVDDSMGKSWFIHFQDKDAYGRIVHLQPVSWINDWPVAGSDKDKNGTGEPVHIFKKPSFNKDYKDFVLQNSDEFNSNSFGLQWQWHANPQPGWSFMTNHGCLRLYSVLNDNKTNLWETPNLLLQKFPGLEFSVIAKIKASEFSAGDKIGLLIMGQDYSYMAVKKSDSAFTVFQVICNDADSNNEETLIEQKALSSNEFYLKANVKRGALCSFTYSVDGKQYFNLGQSFKAKAGRWIGAKVGLFCIGTNRTNDSGYADIDYFRFEKH